VRTSFLIKTTFDSVDLFCTGVSYFGKPVKPVYFFKVGDLLIDSGPSLAVKKIHHALSGQKIAKLLLTHTHEDHSGNAAYLSKALQIPVVGHPLSKSIMAGGFSILPYQKMMFGPAGILDMSVVGESIIEGDYTFQIIPTPGHAVDHISLYEPNKGWLFSGDLYVGERIKYFRKGEILKDQIESLQKLVKLDFDTLFCSHNPQLTGGKEKLIRKLDYFQSLYESVVHHHQAGLSTVEIMKKVGVKDDRGIVLLTFNDVSPRHLITSITDYL
jgi:glyoxylase-like metal-dependent hydrolase (beta-lactamase superfamily II)